MKRLYAIVFASTLFMNIANCESFFEFNGKEHKFVEINNRLVSESCKSNDCLAKSIEIKATDFPDGTDPAASVCINILKGAPFQLHDGKNNEESVCVLDDKSLITFGSIRAEIFLK